MLSKLVVGSSLFSIISPGLGMKFMKVSEKKTITITVTVFHGFHHTVFELKMLTQN